MIKTFIIHLSEHSQSVAYANESLISCEGKNFDAELFQGYYHKTVGKFKEIKNFMPNSRAENFFKEGNMNRFLSKRSIFANGYTLWQKCLELNQNIVVLEHDSICVKNWDFPNFKDVLILNIEDAFHQKCYRDFWKKNKQKPPILKNGIHNYKSPFLYQWNNIFYNSLKMPGAAAYALSPTGAEKLVKSAEKYGWEQNDHFINTYNVNIEYAKPQYFKLKYPNLNLSFGVKL